MYVHLSDLGILRELNLTERAVRVGCDTACGISR